MPLREYIEPADSNKSLRCSELSITTTTLQLQVCTMAKTRLSWDLFVRSAQALVPHRRCQ
jgi:hypothetical protein